MRVGELTQALHYAPQGIRGGIFCVSSITAKAYEQEATVCRRDQDGYWGKQSMQGDTPI